MQQKFYNCLSHSGIPVICNIIYYVFLTFSKNRSPHPQRKVKAKREKVACLINC